MKVNGRAISITVGALWAVALFLTGAANMAWKGYGGAFLEMAASIYPGYDASGTLGDLIVGTLYGLVDGTVCGWVGAWLYNRLAGRATDSPTPPQPIEP